MFDKKHRVREQIIQNGDQVSIKQQKTTVICYLRIEVTDEVPTFSLIMVVVVLCSAKLRIQVRYFGN